MKGLALLRKWKPKLSLREFTYLMGLVGIAIIVVSVLLTALEFSGPNGTAYSMLNRKISTLGKPQFSGWATLFNRGLQVGGVCLMVFIVALGFYVKCRAMLVVTLAGVVMASGVVLVGVCPVTEPQCHKVAAQITFFSGAVTTTAFTVALLWGKPDKLSRWLAVPSGMASLAFVAFAVILYSLYEHPQQVFINGPPGDKRPYLWLPSLLEWLVFAIVVVWLLTLVLYLAWQQRYGGSARKGTLLAHKLARSRVFFWTVMVANMLKVYAIA